MTLGKLVTNIGAYAFTGCVKLKTLPIPDTVITIGGGAFASCQSLEAVTIPEGINHAISVSPTAAEGSTLSPFFGCSGLRKVTIKIPSVNGSHTDWINDEALKTTGITAIVFSEGVTAIGGDTFRGCTTLKSLAFPESLTAIGSDSFWGCSGLEDLKFPARLSSIGSSAFRECAGLKTLEIPDLVTAIGDHTFRDCRALTGVRMAPAITSIGKYAFAGCAQLRELSIPEKVTTLGEGAFASCQSLESVTIPVGLNHAISTSPTTALLEGATLSQFYGCSELTSVTIKTPSLNTGFTAWIDNDLLKTNAITEIILAEGVDDIGDGTFKDKASLERVILPVNASRIGSAAFQNCTGMKELSIGRGTTSIAGNAFDGCKNLTAINIAADNTAHTSKEGLLFNKSGEILLKCPEGKTGACALAEGVTTINGNAFRNCALLTGISIPEGVTGISGHAFSPVR